MKRNRYEENDQESSSTPSPETRRSRNLLIPNQPPLGVAAAADNSSGQATQSSVLHLYQRLIEEQRRQVETSRGMGESLLQNPPHGGSLSVASSSTNDAKLAALARLLPGTTFGNLSQLSESTPTLPNRTIDASQLSALRAEIDRQAQLNATAVAYLRQQNEIALIQQLQQQINRGGNASAAPNLHGINTSVLQQVQGLNNNDILTGSLFSNRSLATAANRHFDAKVSNIRQWEDAIRTASLHHAIGSSHSNRSEFPASLVDTIRSPCNHADDPNRLNKTQQIASAMHDRDQKLQPSASQKTASAKIDDSSSDKKTPSKKRKKAAEANFGYDPGKLVPLSLPSDESNLSNYQCLLREQICLFEAGHHDIQCSAQGRNKPITLRQVGILCVHCSSIPPGLRPCGAVYFPAKLSGLYQASQNMATNHFSKSCRLIPEEIRSKLAVLKEKKSAVLGGGKQFWANGARVLGVVEGDGDLRFAKDSELR